MEDKIIIEWKKPWIPLSKEQARGIEQEAKKEINKNHPLYGKNIQAIAKRIDYDDYLFKIDTEEFAVVHLTFSQHPEPDSQWPHTTKYNNIDDFVKNCLIPDNKELEK